MKFKNINIKYLIFTIIFISYIPYSQLISWGSDYAGYILQGNSMLSFSSDVFIEKQLFLHSLSLNPKYPIYTSIGMPLLLGFISVVTNLNIYIVKLLIPISILIICNIVLKNTSNYLIPIILCIHPSILSQYRDIVTEIPATMFLLLGIFLKNKYFRIFFLTISCLIRPTFIIFAVIEYFFNKNKRFNEFILFSLVLGLIQSLSTYLFSMNIYGFYKNASSTSDNYGVFQIIFNNLQNLNFARIQFFFKEIGLMLTGFSNAFNLWLGIIFLVFMLILKNRYSLMVFAFSIFHLGWGAEYFARYLLPTLFIAIFAINEIYNFNETTHKKYLVKLALIFLIVFTPQNFYGYTNLENQSGPHNIEVLELFNFVNSYDQGYLYSFHQPRTFRLFTGLDAYKLDGQTYKDTIIICNKKEEVCEFSSEYEEIFSNMAYEVYQATPNTK